jgi:GNAT superfamily N-acetyltransferase
MSGELSTSLYEQGDESGIVELLDLVFDGWPKFDLIRSKLDHWFWKYQENYIDYKLAVVTKIGDRIIGCGHSVPQEIKIKDNVHLFCLGGDVAVHPDFRRLGIRNRNLELSTKLRRESGSAFILAITGNPIVIDMFERSKDFHRLPIELTHYVYIKDIDLHLKMNPIEDAWIQKIGFQVLKNISGLKQRFSSPEEDVSDLVVKEVSEFDERIEEFWLAVQNAYDLIVVNNKKYLNWRYCDPRAGDFKIFVAEEMEKILGFTVLRINRYREDYPVGLIVELISIPGRPEVVDALLDKAVDFFQENNVNIINFLAVKGYKHHDLLTKNGFLDSRRNHFIYNSPLQDIDYLKDVAESPTDRIHLSWGILDVV